MTEDDITENVTESEAKEKHKRKLHPLIKTALLSAGISTAVCACIIIGLTIYVRINALITEKLGNLTNKISYAANYLQLILLMLLIIFVSTTLGTIGHFIIHLIKKKRRK